jgi:hypothetical protein
MLELDYDIIKRSKKLKNQFRQGFEKVLNEFGEYLIGDVKTNHIIDVFKLQGYWSGVLYNVYFDFKTNDFEVTFRHM